MTTINHKFIGALVAMLATLALREGCRAATPPKPTPAPITDEEWRNQFKAKMAPFGTQATPAPVEQHGKVTYTLQKPKEPTEEEQQIFTAVSQGMEKAVSFYNRYTTIKKQLNVVYSPGTPTADGNINGTIRFGKNARNARVLMHEICHTVGIGTHPKWGQLMVDHLWQGKQGNKVLQELTKDPTAQIHGDHMHFWPYGLNYDTEVKSDEDFIRHAKIVEAMVQDLKAAR